MSRPINKVRVNFTLDSLGSPIPYPSEHGQYVRYSDYAALVAELEQSCAQQPAGVPVPHSKASLTAAQILALDRRSNMTDDEALRYGRAVELLIERCRDNAGAEHFWHNGAPPHPYRSEWFLAELQNGDRVVLTALPEDFSYDFKTADETYFNASFVGRWAQFPDSEYVAYVPEAPDADHSA